MLKRCRVEEKGETPRGVPPALYAPARRSLALPLKTAAKGDRRVAQNKKAGKTNLPGLCVGDPDYFTLRKNKVPDTVGTYGLVAPVTVANGPVTLAADCKVPV